MLQVCQVGELVWLDYPAFQQAAVRLSMAWHVGLPSRGLVQGPSIPHPTFGNMD